VKKVQMRNAALVLEEMRVVDDQECSDGVHLHHILEDGGLCGNLGLQNGGAEHDGEVLHVHEVFLGGLDLLQEGQQISQEIPILRWQIFHQFSQCIHRLCWEEEEETERQEGERQEQTKKVRKFLHTNTHFYAHSHGTAHTNTHTLSLSRSLCSITLHSPTYYRER
jgi:hypothetical protein